MGQMTTGAQLTTFITALNGGATIDPTLLEILIDTAKAIVEQERPWVVLRKVDTSKTVATSSTWQTAISLATIADFDRFYSEDPIYLFDGTNTWQPYRLVPFDRRLQYKDSSNTACYDENTKTLYLNGTVPYTGTLYISYVSTSTHIDPTATTDVWTVFPSRFLPVLAFYSVGVYMGAVDYDTINHAMLPQNSAVFMALKEAMVNWDNDKQLNALEHNDPTDSYPYPRGHAIDRGD